MQNKKMLTKVVLVLLKILKVILILIPIFIGVTIFWGGGITFLLALLQIHIIYTLIGLVLYGILFNYVNNKISKIGNSLKSTANLSTAEWAIVNTIGSHATGSNSQDFFPAFFPPEEINIKVYKDADESLAGYKTFNFDYINKTNPLLEKELFKQLEKVLQAHGLTRVQKNPQITISMDFFIGKKEQYTPPTTVTSTELKSVWNFGMIGWTPGGFSSEVPVTSSYTTPGYTTTTYYSNIRLNFLNHSKLAKGSKLETPPLIWLGEADSEGVNSDIRGIASRMFDELIGEFPEKSGKPPKRYTTRFIFGGLGLGFDTTDWRVVHWVEPSSVAAEHGIKPGDTILKVNGERAIINWAGPDARYLKKPALYRSKDPYFKYVLSNHGDPDVELVIKSAETGKAVTLRMRPRSEDVYLHTDITRSIGKIAGANPLGIVFVVVVTAIAIYYIFIK